VAQDRERTLTHVETLLRLGRLDAAIAEYVRLVEEQPSDWNATIALGDLYARIGDGPRAVGQFVRVADHLVQEGFFPRAAALYKRILRLDDRDEHARLCLAEIAERQGLLAEARAHLRRVVDGRLRSGDTLGAADVAVRLAKLNARDTEARGAATATAPRILVAVARMEFERGHIDRGRAALARWLAQKPECPDDLLQFSYGLELEGLQDAAFACVDLVADQAQREGDWNRAVAALSAFVDRVPDQLNALMKLVEVSADGHLEGPMFVAQARLADA
jgi:tetratricopeptide (TPR) repeat protein